VWGLVGCYVVCNGKERGYYHRTAEAQHASQTRAHTRLVDVQVQHQHPLHRTAPQQLVRGVREVVQDAVAAAMVPEGVVGAARCVEGQALLERQLGG